jgi:hypothetical protein
MYSRIGATIGGAMGEPTANSTYSAGMLGSAPVAGRARAPPVWRSSTTVSGLPESGPQAWTRRSTPAAGSESSSAWSAMAGTGCSGSMCMWLRAAGETIANVSISGSSARSGASAAAAECSSPSAAPSITTIRRPRTTSGISGTGGTWISRAEVVMLSSAVAVHSRHACRTSRARSQGHSIMPA